VPALYTESFFTCMAVLFLERITRDERPKWSVWLFASIVLFTRPVGILFVGPAIIWWISNAAGGERRALWWLIQGAFLLAVLALPGIDRDKLRIIVEGEVISGSSRYPGAIDRLEGSSVMAAQWLLIKEHPVGEVLGLFFRRISSLFTLTRPWYSSGHNALLAAHYLLYPLAVIGWIRYRRDRRIALLSIVLLFNALLIGFTYDEWSGRFLVPLFPILILFAASGVATLPWMRRPSVHGTGLPSDIRGG
jgi:hypothetical protein